MVGAHSLEEMVGKLKRPRRVMILVKAGAAVDAFIDKLVPLMEKVRESLLKNRVDTNCRVTLSSTEETLSTRTPRGEQRH